MKRVKVLILRTAGINCDFETQSAFELCGAHVERLHINCLANNKNKILNYDILAFPGGFSYGDDISSGKILANEIKNKFKDQIKKFALSGRPIIGICNGFQILVKMGLLPDPCLFEQMATLSYNDSDKFECRWIYLKTEEKTNCLWTRDIASIISLPVAHGEGKFIPKEKKVLEKLNKNNQIVFRYCTKEGKEADYPLCPNGATENIAGICNKKGNILGLMPHPERYVLSLQHPCREGYNGEYGWGKMIFQNAVNAVK
ncbi:MAG: phosphoribosylformylglycinamidine synthase I [Endomicrobium sp.]|nr:phosphoribosylformylglycinamidine synthase I [Endomicrobium sp.]